MTLDAVIWSAAAVIFSDIISFINLIKPAVVSSIALPEIVWLCMWPATWRIKCTASIHSSHCMWGYSRTGASRPYESISVVYRFVLCNNMYIDLNLFFIFSFMTYVNSSELGAKYQTQITFSWYCIIKIIMHNKHCSSFIFDDSLETVFSPKSILNRHWYVFFPLGWLCWPRILQLRNVHIFAST